MIELKTPRGLNVQVPETVSEDVSSRFDLTEMQAIRDYYEDNGYVIVRGLYSSEQCRRIRNLWDTEVKPFEGFMYRQATAKAERHVKNEMGWIMNPILNLQSVNPREFPQFREFATREILGSENLSAAFSGLLDDPPKLVQSMYFEGNSATWEHQDSYYLDSENIGEMSAAWIALETISAGAGRFFICPKSHRIRLDDHSKYNNIAENHEGYIASVVEKIKAENLAIRAPVMNQGDVLFWNALTIHGSLDSQDTAQSRSSITCHAIPNTRRFLQLQTRILDLSTELVNRAFLYKPKDLALAKNQVILFFESRFPGPFYWLKRQAIIFLVRRKST